MLSAFANENTDDTTELLMLGWCFRTKHARKWLLAAERHLTRILFDGLVPRNDITAGREWHK